MNCNYKKISFYFFLQLKYLPAYFEGWYAMNFFGLAHCPWIHFLDLLNKLYFHENIEAWINIWSVAKTTQVAWRFKQPTKKLEFLFFKNRSSLKSHQGIFIHFFYERYVYITHQSLPIIYIYVSQQSGLYSFVCTTN